MSRKDEILDEIVSTEKQIAIDKLEWKIQQATVSDLSKKKDVLQKAYDEIKRNLSEITETYNQASYTVRDLERNTKNGVDKVADLKRELSRLIDAERIVKALAAERDAFRDACLGASWRSENRSDGMGAMTHQIDGGIHLAVSKKAILGDKRGLGKSLTSLIYLDLLDAKRVIAVCPSDTMNNFAREVVLWTPHRMPVVIGKIPRAMRDFYLQSLKSASEFFIIVNYEAWRKDPHLLQDLRDLKADSVLIDESHNIMNANTVANEGVTSLVFANNLCSVCESPRISISMADDNLAKCACGNEGNKWEFSTVKNVLPLSGTAIMNKPQELFPQLHLVDPANFPDKFLFLRDFCRKNIQGRWTWQQGGEQRLVKMIGPRLLIRNRDDAGVSIPPPKPVEHLITNDEFKTNYSAQWKAYEQARKYAQIVLSTEKELAMSMAYKIVVLMRLRQVLVWPAAIELKWADPDTKLIQTQNLEVYESIKLDYAEKLIQDIIEEGDRVVVFSQFKDGLAQLQKRLGHRSAIYDGSTSPKMKDAIQLDFDVKTSNRDNYRWDVVLANYKSGGVGLNFNTASQVILLDSAWNPGTEDQAEGRVDRLGQEKQTITHHIRVEQTIDTWMAMLIEEKRKIIGGFESEVDVYTKAYDALMRGEI